MSEDAYARFEPEALHALSDEELDALPFGVIALGEGGRIARYNLAEARFARLDRNAVLGRSFFQEIARCTATPEFQGRFEDLAGGTATKTVRFGYVFAFRFGAQNVEVDMGNVHGAPLVYICVNRRKFLPRQRDVSPSLEAPLLAELEPEAEAAFVARDARARRRLDLDATFVDALLHGLAQVERPSEVLRTIGARWGRSTVVDLETEALEQEARGFADRSMKEAMAAIGGTLERQRVGRLSFDYTGAERGFFAVAIARNAFAEVVSAPGCAIFEGFFGTIFSHLAGRPVVARETSCQAGGAAQCSFLCLAASRADALASVLDGRNRSPAEVAEALAKAAADG